MKVLFQRKQTDVYRNYFAVNVQQQDCTQGEKKTFPPEELVNKNACELPEGVDPTQKEVRQLLFVLVTRTNV